MRKERFGTYRDFYEILKTLDFEESIENKFGKSKDTDTHLSQELVRCMSMGIEEGGVYFAEQFSLQKEVNESSFFS